MNIIIYLLDQKLIEQPWQCIRPIRQQICKTDAQAGAWVPRQTKINWYILNKQTKINLYILNEQTNYNTSTWIYGSATCREQRIKLHSRNYALLHIKIDQMSTCPVYEDDCFNSSETGTMLTSLLSHTQFPSTKNLYSCVPSGKSIIV